MAAVCPAMKKMRQSGRAEVRKEEIPMVMVDIWIKRYMLRPTAHCRGGC